MQARSDVIPQTHIVIQRGDQRFRTTTDWLESYQSFSFGPHYDPANTHHGLLLVNNEDWVKPGTGFGTHPHQDMEIVTWVLSGRLAHKDSEGNSGIIVPGLAQRMSAGTGISHSEKNPSPQQPVHLIQMWVVPDKTGLPPGYEQRDRSTALAGGGLVAIASGRGHEGAVKLHQRGAVLWGGRLKPGETVRIPDAPFLFVYTAKGAADVSGGGRLEAGDTARVSNSRDLVLTAAPETGCEVLVWEMHGEAR